MRRFGWCSLLLQGGWEDDESIDEAACREAFEEAGVKGIISVGALTYSILTWPCFLSLFINLYYYIIIADGLVEHKTYFVYACIMHADRGLCWL